MSGRKRERAFLIATILLQDAGAAFFCGGLLLSLIGVNWRPLAWELYELLELSVALGLIAGCVMSITMLRRSLHQRDRAREGVKRVSGEFQTMLEDHFCKWSLTPAEKDVALFAIKGMSTKEIASLRKTSEGTIKAQSASVYRKAGVSSRTQLLSLFVEELFLEQDEA